MKGGPSIIEVNPTDSFSMIFDGKDHAGFLYIRNVLESQFVLAKVACVSDLRSNSLRAKLTS